MKTLGSETPGYENPRIFLAGVRKPSEHFSLIAPGYENFYNDDYQGIKTFSIILLKSSPKICQSQLLMVMVMRSIKI